MIIPKDYSKKNLQKASFKNEDLSYSCFSDSDLRGADFSGSDLTGADFTHVRTGITPANTLRIFIAALVVSLISGYLAMLTGHTVQVMLASNDQNIRFAGISTIVIVALFICYYYWKGGISAIRYLMIPAVIVALLVSLVAYVSGLGSSVGMFYQILALILVVFMFIVGTIARAAAGSLSNILFLIVALSGGMFGKSLGGGIGTVIMAVACAQISKRALSGAKGFEALREIVFLINQQFGTSFRNSQLSNANFSGSTIRNSDFTNADISTVNWGDGKKLNYITSDHKFTIK
jgi:hypothetical protein